MDQLAGDIARLDCDLPGPDAIRFVLESFMKFFTEQVGSFAHNQSAIVGPVWQKIDQPLETSESGTSTILILVRPWLVLLEVVTIGEAQVHRIEGYDQVFRLVDFFEDSDHAWLCADVPCERLVGETIPCTHAFLIDNRKVLFEDSLRLVAIEAESAGS